MNWRVQVVVCLILGGGIGFASAIGASSLVNILSLAVSIILALILATSHETKLFKRGFVAGALLGIGYYIIIFVLWRTYLDHNTEQARIVSTTVKQYDALTNKVLSLIPISAIWGLLVGALTTAFAKLVAFFK